MEMALPDNTLPMASPGRIASPAACLPRGNA